MTLDLVATLAALALSNPAAAQPTDKNDPERIECRKIVQTESRVGRKKICMARKLWDQMREEHLESTGHRKVDAERSKPCTSLPCS